MTEPQPPGVCGKRIAYRIGWSRSWECNRPAGHKGQHRKERDVVRMVLGVEKAPPRGALIQCDVCGYVDTTLDHEEAVSVYKAHKRGHHEVRLKMEEA